MKTYYKQTKNDINYMMLDSDTSQVGGIINRNNEKNVSLSGNIDFYNKMVTESQDTTKWQSITEENYINTKNLVISLL